MKNALKGDLSECLTAEMYLGHFSGANIGDAMQSQVDVDRVPRTQIVLDVLNYEIDKIVAIV